MTADGQVLDAWYPAGSLGLGAAARGGAAASGRRRLRPRNCSVVVVIGSLADPPTDTLDVYLRLHLLSHRLIQPHQANLDGIFGLLANVAWTSAGPCPPDRVDELRAAARAKGQQLTIYGIDKFPRMIDYVVPSGVRIADADRVRLGAHLATGTTVMHEGFVNFNAGTLGTSMVEGRISAGVVVGDGSDVGGGASIMGTLSGGGKEVIRIGERCLIGANGGLRHLPRRRLRDRGRHLHHGRVEGAPARRPRGQGARPVRPAGPAVLAQLGDRRAGGPPAHRTRHRTERGAARQLTRNRGRLGDREARLDRRVHLLLAGLQVEATARRRRPWPASSFPSSRRRRTRRPPPDSPLSASWISRVTCAPSASAYSRARVSASPIAACRACRYAGLSGRSAQYGPATVVWSWSARRSIRSPSTAKSVTVTLERDAAAVADDPLARALGLGVHVHPAGLAPLDRRRVPVEQRAERADRSASRVSAACRSGRARRRSRGLWRSRAGPRG